MKNNYKYLNTQLCAYIKLVFIFLSSFSYYYKIEFFFHFILFQIWRLLEISISIVTEELYKKDLHDPDNHDGVITDLETDIPECEVKWALESITTNKASGGDGIQIGRAHV